MAQNQRSRRFCFTLNNPTDEQRTIYRDLGNSAHIKYLVFGEEIAPTTLTPHLQGFVVFSNARRFGSVTAAFPGHFSIALGTNLQASEYCKKDGRFEEFGSFTSGSQGHRSDVDRLVEWLDAFIVDNGRPPNEQEIAIQQPAAYLKHSRLLQSLGRLRSPRAILRDGTPREWQQQLVADLAEPADDRAVRFYVDKVGGTGKSWFQGWYYSTYPETTQLLGVGKVADLAYAIDESKSVFLFNVPRTAMQYLQYTIFEQLKDKWVFNSKYQSSTKVLRTTPHVIVFCNEDPDEEKMSADRFDIRYI